MNDDVGNEGVNGTDFSRLETRLSTALRRHADGISPAPDAYRRLVDAVGADGGRRRQRDWVRPLSVAAATIVAVGIGALFLDRVGSQNVDTVAPARNAASAIGADDDVDLDDPPADAEPSDVVDDAASPEALDMSAGDDSGDVDDDPGTRGKAGPDEEAVTMRPEPSRTVYAPIGWTRLEAAQQYLDLLGFDQAVPVERGDRVAVYSAGEGEPVPTGTVLLLEPQDPGYVVVEAVSDRVEFVIEDGRSGSGPDRSAIVVGPELMLTGKATGVDDTVIIEVLSAGDGTRLTGTSVTAGTGGLAGPFEVQLPLFGSDRGWIIARSAAETTDSQGSFAARPVLLQGTPDTTAYTVVGLSPNDVDGGLVVRAVPAGERLGVIPLGSTGVRRRPEPPRMVGTVRWLPVTTPDGLEGWVAAAYLAPDRDISINTLISTATQLAGRLAAGESAFGADLGVGRPFYVGTLERPMKLPGEVATPSIWTARRAVMDNGEPVITRLFDFYRVDRWGEARIGVPEDYVTTRAEASARSHFGSLPSVVIETIDPDSGDRHRVHLFLSRPPDELTGPKLRLHGILTEPYRSAPPAPSGGGDIGDDA